MSFIAELKEFAEAKKSDEELKPFADAVEETVGALEEATLWFMNNALENFDHAGAGSSDYMHLFGITVLTYMWAQMVEVAHSQVNGGSDDPYYVTKVKTGHYFIERCVPDIHGHLAKIKTGADRVMSLSAEEFETAQ